MTPWSGERIGRLSLRLDAAYCAVVGVAVASLSSIGASLLVVLALLAVAADVALFAGSQSLAIRRLRHGA